MTFDFLGRPTRGFTDYYQQAGLMIGQADQRAMARWTANELRNQRDRENQLARADSETALEHAARLRAGIALPEEQTFASVRGAPLQPTNTAPAAAPTPSGPAPTGVTPSRSQVYRELGITGERTVVRPARDHTNEFTPEERAAFEQFLITTGRVPIGGGGHPETARDPLTTELRRYTRGNGNEEAGRQILERSGLAIRDGRLVRLSHVRNPGADLAGLEVGTSDIVSGTPTGAAPTSTAGGAGRNLIEAPLDVRSESDRGALAAALGIGVQHIRGYNRTAEEQAGLRGSSPTSVHPHGQAVDISPEAFGVRTRQEAHAIAEQRLTEAGFTGFEVISEGDGYNHVHIEWGPNAVGGNRTNVAGRTTATDPLAAMFRGVQPEESAFYQGRQEVAFRAGPTPAMRRIQGEIERHIDLAENRARLGFGAEANSLYANALQLGLQLESAVNEQLLRLAAGGSTGAAARLYENVLGVESGGITFAPASADGERDRFVMMFDGQPINEAPLNWDELTSNLRALVGADMSEQQAEIEVARIRASSDLQVALARANVDLQVAQMNNLTGAQIAILNNNGELQRALLQNRLMSDGEGGLYIQRFASNGQTIIERVAMEEVPSPTDGDRNATVQALRVYGLQ